jgi:TPR repeat protein
MEAAQAGKADYGAILMLYAAPREGHFPQLELTRDSDQAQKWIRKAAEKLWDAKFMLGFMYFHGRGVSQDYAEAAKWLSEPASRGHIGAQQLLGVMYYKGLGVAQDYAAAYKLLDAPAANGDSQSQLILGVMYTRSRGVEQDLVQAYAWFDLASIAAASTGQKQERVRGLEKTRDEIAKQLTADQIKEAQRMASEWLMRRSVQEEQTALRFK